MERKTIRCVEDLEVYKKAVKLFDNFLEIDFLILREDSAGRVLANNQLRCLDSICANMEEGYERRFGKEAKNFFRISKGSTGEARGRYKRLKKVLPESLINERVAVLNETRAMLASLIEKWR